MDPLQTDTTKSRLQVCLVTFSLLLLPPPLSFLSCTSSSASINVKGLSANSETAVLARELVTRCELIDPVRLPEVEQLLVYLQNRQSSGRRGSAEGKCTYTHTCHACILLSYPDVRQRYQRNCSMFGLYVISPMNALCVGLNGSFCAVSESLTRPGGDGEARTRGSFVPPSDDIEEVTQLVCSHVCVCISLSVCVCL